MVKCLVTGGTGFIGSHLVRRLSQDGNDVRLLVRPTSNLQELKNLHLEIVYGDITSRKAVSKSVKDIELVYHLASAFRKVNLPNKLYWEIDVEGTRNILEASLHERVRRFLHCSTVGVHGNVSKIPANESTPYNPGDIYQKTKVEGEKLVKKYCGKGLPATIFRPSGVYGPGDTRFLRLFNYIKSGKFVMIGRGDVYYHMTYISDLIEGVCLCSQKKCAIGETYILAGEKYVTLKQLAEIIAEILDVPAPRRSFPYFTPVYLTSFLLEKMAKPFGVDPPIHRRRVDFFRKNRAFDLVKARKELGYKPRISLERGLRLTAEWYSKNGYL